MMRDMILYDLQGHTRQYSFFLGLLRLTFRTQQSYKKEAQEAYRKEPGL